MLRSWLLSFPTIFARNFGLFAERELRTSSTLFTLLKCVIDLMSLGSSTRYCCYIIRDCCYNLLLGIDYYA